MPGRVCNSSGRRAFSLHGRGVRSRGGVVRGLASTERNYELPRRIRSCGASARAGFSLIELIVTISIISVLLGIGLPVIPRVLDSARKTACQANLHGIAQGVRMYLDSHKQKYPSARFIPPPWLSGDTDPPLSEALADYVESPDAWRCPGDKVVFDFEYTDDKGRPRTTGMSYSYEIRLSGIKFESSFFARFLQLQPRNTPLLHDFDGGGFETQDGQIVQVDFFHQKRNILFADEHVE